MAKNRNSRKQIKTTPGKKDWTDSWKRGMESNLLSIGMSGKSVIEPQRDSSIIYTCLKIISQNFAAVPTDVFLYDKKVTTPDDNVVRYFKRLNYEFWEKLSLLFSLRGEVFLYIPESEGQRAKTNSMPGALVPLDGRNMKEILNDNRELIGWKYNQVPLSFDEVIHIKNFNTVNPYRGMSPILALQMSLDTEKYSEEWNKNLLGNGATPSGIITLGEEQPYDDDEIRKLKSQWQAEHGNRTRKTAVLSYGMSYTPISLTQQDMDFINGRAFNRTQIISAMGVPEPLVNYDSKGVYETLVPALRTFWTQTIKPIAHRLQQKLNYELLDRYAPGYQVKFNFDNIVELQDDYSKRCEQGIKLQMLGFHRNEINKNLNLGFEESTDGNTRYIPSNYIPEDMQLEEVPSFNESNDKKATNIVTKETKSARDRRIQLTFERTHTQLEKQMYSKLKKYFFNQRTTILKAVSSIKKTTLENIQLLNSINIWDAENKKLVQTITPLFVETVKAGGQFALNNLGFAEREYILNTQIVQQRANLITGVNKTIFNQIKMEVNEGINLGETIDDITKRIKDVYNTVSSRARTIARTEVTATLNQASLSEYEKNGVQQVEWIAAMDEKTREAHVENANAGPRNIGEAFPSGETYPGQTSPNCRCTISPYIS